jgi:hypothetical protein
MGSPSGQTREETLEIALHLGIGILLDQEARRGVAQEKASGSRSAVAIRRPTRRSDR